MDKESDGKIDWIDKEDESERERAMVYEEIDDR